MVDGPPPTAENGSALGIRGQTVARSAWSRGGWRSCRRSGRRSCRPAPALIDAEQLAGFSSVGISPLTTPAATASGSGRVARKGIGDVGPDDGRRGPDAHVSVGVGRLHRVVLAVAVDVDVGLAGIPLAVVVAVHVRLGDERARAARRLPGGRGDQASPSRRGGCRCARSESVHQRCVPVSAQVLMPAGSMSRSRVGS